MNDSSHLGNATYNIINNITNHVLSNDMIKSSVQQDYWGLVTALATIALVGATIFVALATHWSNRETNKNTIVSNERAEREFTERMKPLITIEDAKFTEAIIAPNLKEDDENHPGFVFYGLIKNEGFSSARNIKVRFKITNTTDIKEVIRDFKPKDNDVEFYGTIPSKGTYPLIRTVHTKLGSNLAIWMEYDYLKEEKSQCLVIFGITKATLPPIWYDDYDIVEARK